MARDFSEDDVSGIRSSRDDNTSDEEDLVSLGTTMKKKTM